MNKPNRIAVISGIIVLALFSVTAFRSYGFDDKYANIRLIENASSCRDLIEIINREDVHPPVSYIINYILWIVTGNWNAVRLIGAIVSAASIWLYWYLIFFKKTYAAGHSADKAQKLNLLFSFIIICLNPTLLMWGTSIRWYTYFLPLVCVIGGLAHDTKLKKVPFWCLLREDVSCRLYFDYYHPCFFWMYSFPAKGEVES